jgi:hypothetical protein
VAFVPAVLCIELWCSARAIKGIEGMKQNPNYAGFKIAL